MITAIAIIIVVMVLFFAWALCYHSSRACEVEERIYDISIKEWRKGLQRGDLVQCDVVQYRFEYVNERGWCCISNYSGESYAMINELWPVE